MKTENTLKNLNISIHELYNGKKQINIKLSDKPYMFHVVLNTGNDPDCKISYFGANLWARTEKGVNREKYKTIGILQRELIKLIKRKIDTKGLIKFSLSNQVYTF